jgi:hypothetical protein
MGELFEKRAAGMRRWTRWTGEEVARLLALVEEDRSRSGSDLGRIFGVSRCSIIGKLRRLGVFLTPKSAAGKPVKINRKASPEVVNQAPRVVEDLAESGPVTIAGLDFTAHCRFVLGERRDDLPLYCGKARQVPGDCGLNVYCEEHARRTGTRR